MRAIRDGFGLAIRVAGVFGSLVFDLGGDLAVTDQELERIEEEMAPLWDVPSEIADRLLAETRQLRDAIKLALQAIEPSDNGYAPESIRKARCHLESALAYEWVDGLGDFCPDSSNTTVPQCVEFDLSLQRVRTP